MRVSPWCRGQREGGFALLITVTLLAFVVILLVGLAAYTRIETAVAGNVQRQAQARENALLALNVAIGHLQRHAGPDTRVTATAHHFSGANGTRHYTGVWSSDPAATATPATPLTWLVSGNEFALADQITPAAPGPTTVDLVGRNTLGTTNRAEFVAAPLVDIRATGVPGTPATANTTVGHYAWWVGDQGVKAPVAASDGSPTIDYAPFNTAETLGRLRQQTAGGAGAADSSGATVFEPRDTNNAALVKDHKVTAPNQLAFLRSSSNAPIGLARLQQNFHAWSPNNFAVLANAKSGGLRRDLSLKPDLLGPTFAAWSSYRSYMEVPSLMAKPGETATISFADAESPFPAMLPPYTENPVRRRYVLRPPSSGYPIAPVLSFFGLAFSVRNNAANTELEVSARSVVGLWNPYTSALVPEDLQIVVKGLPERINVHDSQSPGHQHVNLRQTMADQVGGGDLKFLLPFVPNGTQPDRSSWLPGRVYSWSAESNTSDPADGRGKPMAFYERDATRTGAGVVRATGEPPLAVSKTSAAVYRWCRFGAETNLVIELRRASDGEVLAEFHGPTFAEFVGDPDFLETGHDYLDFAFIFRLPDATEIPANETATWLQAAGRDPREISFPARGYVGLPSSVLSDGRISPWLTLYASVSGSSTSSSGRVGKTGFDASYPDRLLDRDSTGSSYNEDVPVFELPRSPLLSLGSLQHMAVAGARPFSLGNSWGGPALNAAFDQFFFSGLAPGVEWTTVQQPLPNSLLRVLRRHANGAEVVADDLNGANRLADGYSSRHLLQGGAFNLNSVNKAAWIAVLRSLRFPAGAEFSILDVDEATGTAPDVVVAAPEPFASRGPVAAFPRFAQSAQEVFKADVGYAQSQFGGGGPTGVNTPLFRRGIRTLAAADVATLADKIVALIGQKHADSGPFRSLEEFLGPSPLFLGASGGAVSLLEKAIEDAALNDDAHAETGTMVFGSQWLTQADFMTALAPILFTRSDTFIVRTYGEAVNPATNAVEGRAWAEAIVQRLPEFLESSDPPETDAAVFKLPADSADPSSSPTPEHQRNDQLGRRFKVVSFRWLTRSDI